MRTLVLAEFPSHVDRWRRMKRMSPADVVYVTGPESLEGWRGKDCRIVFLNRWYCVRFFRSHDFDTFMDKLRVLKMDGAVFEAGEPLVSVPRELRNIPPAPISV